MDKDVIRMNRECLNSTMHWSDDEDYRTSRSHYGCPVRLCPLLRLSIDDGPA